MWSYIARRLLVTIPTLFGVTIVSFVVMQIAPGDPIKGSLGSDGAQSGSSETRESYLLRKRDLKLDLPLILNFRHFTNYVPSIRHAAYYRSLTDEQFADELTLFTDGSLDEAAAGRLAFLESLKIKEFQAYLADPKKHGRLRERIRDYSMVWCEDQGSFAVPEAMQVLLEEDLSLSDRRGVVACLNLMVQEPLKKSYSREPTESETPLVLSVWKNWWDREKDQFRDIDPQRKNVLREQLATMAAATDRSRLFDLLKEEYAYSRADMPFFIESLIGDSSFQEKVISAAVLNLYVSEPIRMSLMRDDDESTTAIVMENWRLHYELNRETYHPSMGTKIWGVVGNTQYSHMVWRLVTFQFGRSSVKTRDPVREKLWNAFLVSAPIVLLAQLIIYFIAIPIGILCATHRSGWVDRIMSLVLFLLYSIPPFVAAMLFLLFFCYADYLKWFPMERLHSVGAEHFSWGRYLLDYLWHAFLPVVCLSLFSLAGMAMYSRSAMLDVLGQDFIRTARAKGLSSQKVIYKHALRNGMIPILTLFSSFLPALLGGSVLIEMMFNLPGLGLLGWESITLKDYSTLMALLYVQAIVVLLSILATDVLYMFVDPRINFEGQGTGG